MKEVKKITTSRQINDAVNTKNGFFIDSVHDLSLNAEILVFRESNAGRMKEWRRSYKLLTLKKEQAVVELLSESTRFRIMSVKFYHRENQKNETVRDEKTGSEIDQNENDETSELFEKQINPKTAPQSVISTSASSVKRNRERSKKHSMNVNFSSDFCFFMNEFFFVDEIDEVECFFVDQFEPKTPSQFVASKQKEVLKLIEKEVFQLTDFSEIPMGIRIFNFRFVNEIKHQSIEKKLKKSRLMMQAYNDFNKMSVLTQSSIIQRVNQRVILCLTAMFKDSLTKLYFRDVIQAYVQSIFSLNREFYIRSSFEFTVMLDAIKIDVVKVVKPLYEIPKAGNH